MPSKYSPETLNAINPFHEWQLLDHELVITSAKPVHAWDCITVPLAKMEYMDSIFIEAPREFYDSIKDRKPVWLKGIRLKIKWMDCDPITAMPGIRMFQLDHKHRLNAAKIIDFRSLP